MIHKHMYCGYSDCRSVELLENDEIITSSAAVYGNMIFVYFEIKNEALGINDVAKGNMKPFPDGGLWAEMVEIFHFFTPKNDEEWVRKTENKTPQFRINKIYMDKVASYIYYHQQLQRDNQYNCDKFFSIFLYGNIGIIYGESPVESITWQDIEGRPYTPIRQDWPQLMAEHFVPWEDGRKTWIELENIGK